MELFFFLQTVPDVDENPPSVECTGNGACLSAFSDKSDLEKDTKGRINAEKKVQRFSNFVY